MLPNIFPKRGVKISWLAPQFFFRVRRSKSRVKIWAKYEKLNYTRLLSSLRKKGVAKKFFDLSSFYIGMMFYVKVNSHRPSSLARSLQIQAGNRAQINQSLNQSIKTNIFQTSKHESYRFLIKNYKLWYNFLYRIF